MFYIKECRDIILSLNIEILDKPWKSIKVNPFLGRFPVWLDLRLTTEKIKFLEKTSDFPKNSNGFKNIMLKLHKNQCKNK